MDNLYIAVLYWQYRLSKHRPKIPSDIEGHLLHACDHTCNICRQHGKDVQIHHIDSNPANNKISNLIVVCLDCHSKVTSKSLGKSFTHEELLRYKMEWEMLVRVGTISNQVNSSHAELFKRFEGVLNNLQEYSPKHDLTENNHNNASNLQKHASEYDKRLHSSNNELIKLANFLIENEHYEKYIEITDYFIKENVVQKATALGNKALALRQLGRMTEAITVLKEAIHIDYQNIENQWRLSHILLDTGKYEEALSIAEKLLESNPADDHSLMIKGNAYLSLEKYDDALKCFEKYDKIHPNEGAILRQIGVIRCGQQKHEEAICFFEKANKHEPNQPDTIFSLGLEAEHLGNFKDALGFFDQMIKLAPNLPHSYMAKGRLLCEHFSDHNKALTCFDNAEKVGQNNVEIFYSKALELSHCKKLKEALEYYNKTLEIDPKYVSALVNIGGLLASLDRPDEGLTYIEKALRLEPYHGIALENKKIILAQLKNKKSS